MKIRSVAALTLMGALFLSSAGAEAGTPTMDGKKVKLLTITANGGLQSNDKEGAELDGPEAVDCAPPRCTKLKFVYKPAKGVKGGLMFSATWSNPLSDFDIYIGELDSRGRATEIASCAFMGTRSAKTYVPAASLRAGRSYVAVIGHFRSINDTANGKIELTPTDSTPKTIPAKADEVLLLNCQL